MFITEAFKQFCKERHAEDKGKNYNLLQEVYANTEFFDVSLYEGGSIEINLDIERIGFNVFDCWTKSLQGLSLPFANNFIKLSEEFFVFVREYSPEKITGSLYFNNGKEIAENTPFTVTLGENESVINTTLMIPFKNTDNIQHFAESYFKEVSAALYKLNSLSKKQVVTDNYSSSSTHADYYRRKGKPTIKVPSRPIYYVLGDKNENVSHKYSQIKSRGELDYSYSFHVRGHWRRISDKTYGKDRNGIYNTVGYTWVNEYIKGEGDLVKKIRVLKT